MTTTRLLIAFFLCTLLGTGFSVANADIFADGHLLVAPKSTTTVSRWGREGLESGDFVMKGGATKGNYLKSGKWQPGAGNQRAPFSSGQEFIVPKSSLAPPSQAATAGFFDKGVFGWVKGLLGQKAYKP